jgi:23S rRNA pseudouridine1911/1915/1917 synthase
MTSIETSSNPVRMIVPQVQDVNKRLDRFLSEQFSEMSRTQIQKMIESQQILVEGKVVKASYRIRGDEHIQLSRRESDHSTVEAEPIPLNIVYEDEDLAVIDKPAGMVVHRGAGVRSGTLVNALLHHFEVLSGFGGADRPGIVHRLDKQTSGLIVVARNDFCHRRLSEQFQSRQVIKKYVALVHGIFGQDAGDINSPIGRDRFRRIKMTTRATRSRPAETHYRVLERFPKFTLVQLHIKTGRTHQIRVHLSSIKHPVVGDTLYGAAARIIVSGNRSLETLDRNFLHAASLEFLHPRTQEPLRFTAELPEELTGLLLSCVKASRTTYSKQSRSSAKVGGQGRAHSRKSCFMSRNIERITKRKTRQSTTSRPPSPDLSPRIAQRRAIRGERRKLVGTLTQGGTRGSCPSLALGYFILPFRGSQRWQRPPAAGLLKNIQSRVPRKAGDLPK